MAPDASNTTKSWPRPSPALKFAASDALHETQRATLNLTWTPIPQLDVVVEFLTGRRVNRDGASGTSGQIQAGWTFRF